MELQELEGLLSDFATLQSKITAGKENKYENYRKQYEPTLHAIIEDKTKRPDKRINSDDGEKVVEVARIAIPMQKRIVDSGATFLCGRPVQLICSPVTDTDKSLLQVTVKTLDDNKMQYENKTIAKTMFSETECAELWYEETAGEEYWKGTPNDKNATIRLRLKILSPSRGDTLYPVFNSVGDMIAFGRGYKVKEDGKEIEHFDLYTDKQRHLGKKGGEGWLVEKKPNAFGKIPVIYYYQPEPDWADVQTIIERMETLVSNLADSNDYFGAPMVFVEGKISGFSAKSEQGKVLQGDPGSKAYYLTWDQAPESVKLEYNICRSLIFDLTGTTDISIEQMKSLGAYSRVALRMLFMGAHLKASDKEEIFGKGVQRRYNFIRAAMTKINLRLEASASLPMSPKFEYFLPENEEELINMLSVSSGGLKMISQKTAVGLHPFVQNPEEELKQLQTEGVDKEMEDNV